MSYPDQTDHSREGEKAAEVFLPKEKNKEMTVKETKSETKDPSCGMTVDEETAIHLKKDGKRFYFCGENCRKQFMTKTFGIEFDNTLGSSR